jgi:thiamine biosynthesis lipoprotein
VAIDLDGIGKGVALDRIAATLKRSGAVPALLNFGESSLLAVGRGPKAGWRVLLRHPLGGFVGEFRLRNGACSTSATLGRRATVEGRRIGHILDPRTGRPRQAAAQAVVLARSAAVAEAVSTALLVLGRRSMNRLAKRLRVEACWIDRSGIRTTRGFVLKRPSFR